MGITGDSGDLKLYASGLLLPSICRNISCLSLQHQDSWGWISPAEFPPTPQHCLAMAVKYCSSAGFALCAWCNYWKLCPRVTQPCAPLSIKAAFIKHKDRCFGAFYVGQEAVYFSYYYFHSTALQHITFLFQTVVWLTLRASLFTNDLKKK